MVVGGVGGRMRLLLTCRPPDVTIFFLRCRFCRVCSLRFETSPVRPYVQCYDPKDLLVRPQVHGHCKAYVPPIDEFVITCIDLEPGQSQMLDPQSSPCLLLVMSGEVSLSGKRIRAGATFMETPSTDPAAAITANVVGDAPVQLYRVYAKDTF